MKNKVNQRAFSLVELSIVILIIGVLVAAVGQGMELLQESRINAARVLTKGSRVSAVNGLVFWLEPSLEESFNANEIFNEAVISQWNDTNPQSAMKLHARAGQKTNPAEITYNIAAGGTSANTKGPVYIEKGINNLPTLRFTNSATDYRYLVLDKSMSNSSTGGMTLFLVMTYRSGAGWFIDRAYHDANFAPVASASAINLGQPLFEFNVAADGSLSPGIRTNTVNFPSIGSAFWDSGYDLRPGKPTILTLQRDYGKNFTLYIDGNSSYAGGDPSKADSGEPIDLDPYRIGRHAVSDTQDTDVDISEMIFFTGEMSSRNRKAIEDYLGKKYNIKVTH